MTIESEKVKDNLIAPIIYLEPSLETTHEAGLYYDCCATPDVVKQKGLYVCRNCAVVHEPVMMDYITYDINANNIHTEKKYNYPLQFYGCRTVFSLENIPGKNKSLYYRLSKLNRYFHNSYEYNMTIANQVLFKFASQLEIPTSIRQHAMRIYIKVVNKRLTVGRSIKHLAIASLYLACLLQYFSREIELFSEVSQIPVKTIRKNYRLILKELNIKLKRTPASHYLSQFAIKLGLSVQFQSSAHNLLTVISKKGVNENSSPKSFAAAAIYVTAKKVLKEKRINQKDLSELSKVSEVTLRKYIKIFKITVDLSSLRI